MSLWSQGVFSPNILLVENAGTIVRHHLERWIVQTNSN